MKSFYTLVFVLTFCKFSIAQPKQNYAQQFNGNQVLQMSTTNTLNLGSAFTLEAWVYLQSASPYGIILGKIFDPRSNDPFLHYVLAFDPSGLKPELIQTTGAIGSYSTATATNAIALNTWVHIAGTLSAGQLKLYVNGVLTASGTSAGNPATVTGVPFALGSGVTPTAQTTCCGITGKMMHARVWSKANSSAELIANKDVQLLGNENGLLACWPMNDSIGQSVLDITPNLNHLMRGTTMNADAADAQVVFINPYFTSSIITLTSKKGNTEDLYIIDYNSDQKQDMIIARLAWPPTYPATYSPMQSLRNNGSMNFTEEADIIGIDSLVHPRDFTVADFNGDQKQDLFIADHGTDVTPFPGQPNRLFLQNADGKLVESSTNRIPANKDFSHNTASADIDNDGDVDIYVCNIRGQLSIGPRLLINNGSGEFLANTFRLPNTLVNFNKLYMSSRFADIDKDGDQDLILGAADNSNNATDALLLNDGTGNFNFAANAMPNRYGNANWGTVAIAVADLNNDTYPDLLMSTLFQYQTCYVQMLINNRNGTFSDSTKNIQQTWPTTNSWIKWIETADFNKDGWMDFIVCQLGGQAKMYYNAGNTKFVEQTALLPGINNTASFRARDFDNDGLTDIAFLSFAGNITMVKNLRTFAVPIDSSGLFNSIKSEKNNTQIIRISPNPFSEYTKLRTSKILNNAKLYVYNTYGQKVRELIQLQGDEIIIQRENLNPGLYYLQILEEEEVWNARVVVE